MEPVVSDPLNQNLDENEENINLHDKNTRKRILKKNKEEQRENIVTSGNIFIKEFKVLLLKNKSPKNVAYQYMQRVLHSIFFFGHINSPPIPPIEFIPQKKIGEFKRIFPKPFQEYNTHLPRQTPYSILLEYVTEVYKDESPDEFMKELVVINESLWKADEHGGNLPVANDFAFTASVITYSCVKDPENKKILKTAYGSSMSCRGKIPRRIMIAISVLYIWDKAISFAVCSGDKGPVIKLPDHVCCTAYNFETQKRSFKEIPPCTQFNRMYSVNFNPNYLPSNKQEDWVYGNYAENESLSKLLHSHVEVRKAICTVSDNGEPMMTREDIENRFKDEHEGYLQDMVKELLISRKFNVCPGDWEFFAPAIM